MDGWLRRLSFALQESLCKCLILKAGDIYLFGFGCLVVNPYACECVSQERGKEIALATTATVPSFRFRLLKNLCNRIVRRRALESSVQSSLETRLKAADDQRTT